MAAAPPTTVRVKLWAGADPAAFVAPIVSG